MEYDLVFLTKKIQKNHFCLKFVIIIFSSKWYNKSLISSCFTIFQNYFTHRTPQKKALGFWSWHAWLAILAYFWYMADLGWVITRSSYKIFFSKSSDHPEHFSYSWYLLKMDTFWATDDWTFPQNHHFGPKSVRKSLPAG